MATQLAGKLSPSLGGVSAAPSLDRHRFLVGLGLLTAFAGLLTLWLGFGLGGRTVTTAVGDLGQVAAALAAGAGCGWLAHRSRGSARRAWALLGASAISWAGGQVVWSYYQLSQGIVLPFPSAADLGFLASIPLAVAGVIALPATKRATRSRAFLDSAMVALSLFFVSWALGLDHLYRQSHAGLLAQALGLAYPIGDIVILTVLFVAFRRSLPSQRGQLALLIGGLAAIAISDSGFAFVSTKGGDFTSPLVACGWIYGYALVGLAPLWPYRNGEFAREEDPLTLWRMMLPWVGLLAVVITAIGLVVTSSPMDPFLAFPGAGLVAILLTNQAITYRDSLQLLSRSRNIDARLREREKMLNDVIDHAPQGVARITVDGRITNVNPRLAAILDLPTEQLIGAAFERFVSPLAFAQAIANIWTAGTGANETYETEGHATRGDGSEFWLHWSMTPIRKLDGSIDYYMAMFDDVTKRHEAEETAQANLDQLEKLNRLKSEFVSTVSHEFRTALVGIQGYSELIRDSEMEVREIKDMANDIYSDAMRLGRMLSEMLDLDRLEAGKIRLNLQALQINDLIRAAIERARVSTDKHEFVENLQHKLPLVLADADRITEVLSNLLSNAIKYSPDGGQIVVRSRRQRGLVSVAVKDQGLGIPPAFISRLFGRYERYEDKNAGKIIGTGLGLAITRQIVEMHDGTISVDSQVGTGSEFTFTIPILRG